MSDINVNATGALKPFDVKGNDKKITAEDIFEIVKDDKKKAAFKEAISDEIEASEKKPAKRAQLMELYYKVDTAMTIKECLPLVKKEEPLLELIDYIIKENNEFNMLKRESYKFRRDLME